MSKRIAARDDQHVSDLAAELVSIAEAEGLPQPEVDTTGERLVFVVTDELYASFNGAPAGGEVAPDQGSGEVTKSGKSRKNRKGDN